MPEIDKAALLKFFQPVIDSFAGMWDAFAKNSSNYILAIILLIVFVVIAKILRFIIRRLGRKLKLDDIAGSLGLTAMLSKIGVSSPVSTVVSNIIYWIIILIAVKTSSDICGIKDISKFIEALVLFLPTLIVAISILFAGLLVAELAKNAIRAALDRLGWDAYSGPISNVIYGLIAVMILTVVLGLLGIETELLNSSVIVILSAVCFGIALSVGLGLRNIAKNLASGLFARDIFPPGTVLEINDTMVVVMQVGVIATRLEGDNGLYFVIPNSILVNELNRGKRPVQDYAGRD